MNYFVILLVSIVLIAFTQNISAQQWSAEQQEVWKSVETYTDLSVKRDKTGFLSYYDDSYRGWAYISDAPYSKEAVTKIISNWDPSLKILYKTKTPVTIWVNGNFAYTHYYYSMLSEDKEGKRQWEKGRWTDILMKKDGKWIMVGDHGGKISE